MCIQPTKMTLMHYFDQQFCVIFNKTLNERFKNISELVAPQYYTNAILPVSSWRNIIKTSVGFNTFSSSQWFEEKISFPRYQRTVVIATFV